MVAVADYQRREGGGVMKHNFIPLANVSIVALFVVVAIWFESWWISLFSVLLVDLNNENKEETK